MMDPFDWAKQRKRAHPSKQLYRRGQKLRETRRLDDNELGKYLATLRHRGRQEMQEVAEALAGEADYRPLSAFARRSGNEYLGRFKILRDHVIAQLPAEWDDEQTFRGLRWLKRLLDIEGSDRKQHREGTESLLQWFLTGHESHRSAD